MARTSQSDASYDWALLESKLYGQTVFVCCIWFSSVEGSSINCVSPKNIVPSYGECTIIIIMLVNTNVGLLNTPTLLWEAGKVNSSHPDCGFCCERLDVMCEEPQN